jgi:5'-methylthioadenosine phosphorylase
MEPPSVSPNDQPHRIGIIGGSGLQALQGLTDVERLEVQTPFSDAPVPITVGLLDATPVAFVQRHGVGHKVPPADINVRANIAALKRVGCTQVLSMSAVGSLQEDVPPGTFVLIDQFIDRSIQREKTYFGFGLVGHVPFGEPTCARMRDALAEAARQTGPICRGSGTYVVMEGPQFSTRAESHMYRQWGGTVIGMTGMPEAKLAREAEMCYAMVAMATDYDCWFDGMGMVTADLVSERMSHMRGSAIALLRTVVAMLGGEGSSLCPHGCHRALDTAIMTEPEHRDPVMLAQLEYVVPRIREI